MQNAFRMIVLNLLIIMVVGCAKNRSGGPVLQKSIKYGSNIYEYWINMPGELHTMSGGEQWVVIKNESGIKIGETTIEKADELIGPTNNGDGEFE